MRNRTTSPTLSIIITAHKEGLLLHKTILAARESASLLPSDVTYEILISLDNPDAETLRCANLWKDDKHFSVLQCSFGNPADNRNYAISKSSGKYVTLCDGDDLMSESWLAKAYEMARSQGDEDFVLRPAVHLQFGYEEKNVTAWFMRDSVDKKTDAIQMAYWNLWTIMLFSTRKVLEETPFRPSLNGFGFEDYLFNADTRAKNIPHLTVPGTVLFYRRRSESVSSEHLGTVLDYSDLFDVSYIKSIPLPKNGNGTSSISHTMKVVAKRTYRFAFDAAKKIGPLNRAMYPVARNMLYKNKSKKLPTNILLQWKKINKIENQLYPTKGEIAKLQFHPLSFDPFNSTLGVIYQRLCHAISNNKIDYLFLAPHMSGRGGTEKLITNYIRALQNIYPNWNIAILSTQPYNQTVLDYFKDLNVDMLDFGGLTRGLGDYEKYIIWSRILIQSKVKRLHIVNDAYWYHWASRHQKLLINNDFKIYISLFMREFVHEPDRIMSFADPDLVQIWPTVTKVFTDNKKVISDALINNAFEPEKIVTHYQPQDFSNICRPKRINPDKPIRILWASRISHQKRPDILKKVADKLGSGFIIDAYGLIEKKQYKPTYFNNSKVNYKGPFNGISSIATEKYDIYLYTSQTDGVPNILLEVAAAGLPIVASDIGGVSEVIQQEKTGMLVDIEDINGYVNAIRLLASDPERALQTVRGLQKHVKDQHSWSNFIKHVSKDIS